MRLVIWYAALMLGLWPLTACAESAPKTPPKNTAQQALPAPFEARVIQVFDGDTVVLANGERVRLLDINTPEMGRDGTPPEPWAVEATTALSGLVLGQTVQVQKGRKERDTYGRLLAHVHVGGVWVNGALVEKGLAHAYTFADNHTRADEIIALENQARQAGVGLWSHPRWTIKNASTCCTPAEMGMFQVVEGRVLAHGSDKDHVYLNFGPDYRTDFTIRMARRDVKKHFAPLGIKNVGPHYTGQTVRVRGHVVPVYGAMVVVTHPAQLEVLK